MRITQISAADAIDGLRLWRTVRTLTLPHTMDPILWKWFARAPLDALEELSVYASGRDAELDAIRARPRPALQRIVYRSIGPPTRLLVHLEALCGVVLPADRAQSRVDLYDAARRVPPEGLAPAARALLERFASHLGAACKVAGLPPPATVPPERQSKAATHRYARELLDQTSWMRAHDDPWVQHFGHLAGGAVYIEEALGNRSNPRVTPFEGLAQLGRMTAMASAGLTLCQQGAPRPEGVTPYDEAEAAWAVGRLQEFVDAE